MIKLLDFFKFTLVPKDGFLAIFDYFYDCIAVYMLISTRIVNVWDAFDGQLLFMKYYFIVKEAVDVHFYL